MGGAGASKASGVLEEAKPLAASGASAGRRMAFLRGNRAWKGRLVCMEDCLSDSKIRCSIIANKTIM